MKLATIVGARPQFIDGRRAVRDKYNWEQEKAKLLRVYKELVEKR